MCEYLVLGCSTCIKQYHVPWESLMLPVLPDPLPAVMPVCTACTACTHDGCRYAHPLDLVPIVDLNLGRVVHVDAYDKPPPVPLTVRADLFLVGFFSILLTLWCCSDQRHHCGPSSQPTCATTLQPHTCVCVLWSGACISPRHCPQAGVLTY